MNDQPIDDLLPAVIPYETIASELALKVTEIGEEPEGDSYDYQGLARAMGLVE